jgi:hypothetical protein
MPDLDSDRYRERERQWRQEAALLSPGHERDACQSLAEAYARLVQIIERLLSPDKSSDQPGGHSNAV